MNSWFTYLKEGLSRTLPEDRIAGREGYSDVRGNLQNLRPFITRHWRRGAFGGLLVLLTSLLAFPQPLITRYLVDDVILNRQLDRLVLTMGPTLNYDFFLVDIERVVCYTFITYMI